MHYTGYRSLIRVQCGQVAKLYSVITNYLLDDSIVEGNATESSLFVDPLQKLTSPLGVRIFSSAHADTRLEGQLADSRNIRLEKDLTPGPGLRTAIDATRSALHSANQLFQRLQKIQADLKDLEDPQSKTSFLIEVSTNQKTFKEYIFQLKEEAAHYSFLFQNKNEQAKQWIYNEPGTYQTLEELPYTLKTKPLAAVVNILLFLQDKGVSVLFDPAAKKQIQNILSSIKELFHAIQKKDSLTQKEDPKYQPFIKELTDASKLAEKISILMNYEVTT